ncbi:hypothetical protein J6590_020476 [Homalodisca vitripennis]|nr:hypothetical protein J6590_020476 [Homalodisca vitripennis]
MADLLSFIEQDRTAVQSRGAPHLSTGVKASYSYFPSIITRWKVTNLPHRAAQHRTALLHALLR